MKFIVVFGIFAVVGFALALPQRPLVRPLTPINPTSGRGCIYIMGRCVSECPVGTHSFTTGCGYLTPEATCEDPDPVPDTRGQICDFSSCYCDYPTVRDTATDTCIKREDCPKKTEETKTDEEKKE